MTDPTPLYAIAAGLIVALIVLGFALRRALNLVDRQITRTDMERDRTELVHRDLVLAEERLEAVEAERDEAQTNLRAALDDNDRWEHLYHSTQPWATPSTATTGGVETS